ncbi:MAG: prepilin-type N-terminal cleavage/methylation domain-containing protein, partial [bacterium]|nr:prepilin-type N-terminal cleavage/methylation domain-containing protein [bacterium]
RLNLCNRFKVIGVISFTGFTLLEIILGVLIFTMVIAAVYTTFRTGLNVYRSGTSMKTVYQTSRAILDNLQPDFRSICGIEETFYDVPPPPPKQDTEETTYGEDTGLIEETTYARNPYPFSGTTAKVSFYCIREEPVVHQSLFREQVFAIRYYLDGTKLFREQADVSAAAGSRFATVDEIADNVVSFRIRYGYLKEAQWTWVEDWDSRLAQYRHPREQKEDSEIVTRRTVPIRIYPDLLPEAIEITFSLQETNGKSRLNGTIYQFSMITKIPTAIKE